MNRFEKFLEVSGIKAGNRQSAEERAQYFAWYHMRATQTEDVDLELISKYFYEAGLSLGDVHALYLSLTTANHGLRAGSFPGRFRLSDHGYLDGKFREEVFSTRRLERLYYKRLADGEIRRFGSRKDELKYWPQTHWAAAWLALAMGIGGLVTGLLAPAIGDLLRPVAHVADSVPPPKQ